jgi:hypothetical protein
MKKQYAVTIDDAKNNPDEVNYFKRWGYEMLDLPDGIVIAIPPNATEDIRIAAQEAQNGNYGALMRATGGFEDQ